MGKQKYRLRSLVYFATFTPPPTIHGVLSGKKWPTYSSLRASSASLLHQYSWIAMQSSALYVHSICHTILQTTTKHLYSERKVTLFFKSSRALRFSNISTSVLCPFCDAHINAVHPTCNTNTLRQANACINEITRYA